jgi:hypothetical protein
MGLSLLAPLFLAGLAAIAIPIYVHLTHRERREPVRFPSLMFLRRIPFRTTKRQRIRHWWLFALRVAAIALVVAAFSRPLLDRGSLGAAVLGSARDIVVLVDRSLSMTVGDRWERAAAAVDEIAGALGEADRATLVAYAERATALTEPTNDPSVLRAAAGALTPGGGRTRIGPAVRLARDFLEPSEFPVREVVIVSDFQAVGAPGADEDRLPPGTSVRVVDVSDRSTTANVSIDAVEVDRTASGPRDRVTVTARVTRRGEAEDPAATVELLLDDARAASERVTLPAGETRPVTFDVPVPSGRTLVGAVRVPDDAYRPDDAFRFVVPPEDPIDVLVLHDPGAPGDGLYLNQALALGERPRFAVTVRSVSRVGAETIRAADVIVLHDVPYPGGAVGRALRDARAAGQGLWVIYGRRNGASAWSGDGAALAGSRPGAMVDRMDDGGGTLSILRYDHPLLAPFAEPRSGDFSAARFFRYRAVDVQADGGVLARYDDGTIALSETLSDGARVVTWNGGLANEWNDLPIQPVFLPFVHEVVRYLARHEPVPGWRATGTVLGPEDFATVDGEAVLERPDGVVVRPDGESIETAVLDAPGLYRLRAVGGSAAQVLAVNPDPAESDLRPGDPEELAAAVTPLESGEARRAELAAALTPAERERRQGLWWYLLLGALLLSTVESVLARRAGRVAR